MPDDNNDEEKLETLSGSSVYIKKVIDRYTPELFCCHSNLEVIRIGVKRVDGQFVRAIALECQHKGFIPLGEEKFPESLGGYPVRVYESYVCDGVGTLELESQGEKVTRDIVRIGSYGSIGPLMMNDTFLSAAHVVCGIDVLLGHCSMQQRRNEIYSVEPKLKQIYHIDDDGNTKHVGNISKVWYGNIKLKGLEYGVDVASVKANQDVNIKRKYRRESQKTSMIFNIIVLFDYFIQNWM